MLTAMLLAFQSGAGQAALTEWMHHDRYLIAWCDHHRLLAWDLESEGWDAASTPLRPTSTMPVGYFWWLERDWSPDRKILALRSTNPGSSIVRFWEPISGNLQATLTLLDSGFGDEPATVMAVSGDGHYKVAGSLDDDELVYVVVNEQGEQELFTPDEFSQKFGWTNNPEQVQILPKK